MAKDPAILFYTSDFLTGTFTMTNEQVGKYIRLLCLQHQSGFLTLQTIELVCNGKDDVVFSKFVEREPNKYINEAMEKHALARKKYSESRSRNRTSTKDINKICFTYDEHMENVNVIENVNEINNENINVFLSKEEAEKIKNEHGDDVFIGAVKELLNYGINKPKKFREYSSHYRTILNWCIDSFKEKQVRKVGINHAKPSLTGNKHLDTLSEGAAAIREALGGG